MFLDAVQTLPALFRWRVDQTPDHEAYRQFDPVKRHWVGYTWSEIDEQIETWRRALDVEETRPCERVAILIRNGIEHLSMDQAALSRGLVPVPLHAIDNPESIIYILGDSGASLLLIEFERPLADIDCLRGSSRPTEARHLPGCWYRPFLRL